MTITLKTLKQTVMNIKTKMQTAHRDNKKKTQKKKHLQFQLRDSTKKENTHRKPSNPSNDNKNIYPFLFQKLINYKL